MPAERSPKSIDSLNKKLERLFTKAAQGDYQSQMRLDAIIKLLDPYLFFCESDLLRIKNKGYPTQVERGLILYLLMSRLQTICQPVGDRIGESCWIKLIDFDNLSWGELLDIKCARHGLVSKAADSYKRGEKFSSLNLLSTQDYYLYQKAKPYFVGRKKPTLKSLATSLLGEEEPQFSERNVSNYLAAVNAFLCEYKEELGWRWYFISSVSTYNRNAKSLRQNLAGIYDTLGQSSFRLQASTIAEEIAQAMKGLEAMKLSAGREIFNMAMVMPKFHGDFQLARDSAASALGAIIKSVNQSQLQLAGSLFIQEKKST